MEDRALHVDAKVEAQAVRADGLDEAASADLLTDRAIERFASENARLQREVQLVIPESPWFWTAWSALGPAALAAVLFVCIAYLK